MSFLLDTNILSELRKGTRANPGVAAWYDEVSTDDIYLSILTIGELRRGVENLRRRDDVAATSLDRWLQQVVRSYADRILPIDLEIAEQWGRFNVPDPLPVADGLLAATAQVRGLTLVTRNVRDIARTGVACLNPFSL